MRCWFGFVLGFVAAAVLREFGLDCFYGGFQCSQVEPDFGIRKPRSLRAQLVQQHLPRSVEDTIAPLRVSKIALSQGSPQNCVIVWHFFPKRRRSILRRRNRRSGTQSTYRSVVKRALGNGSRDAGNQIPPTIVLSPSIFRFTPCHIRPACLVFSETGDERYARHNGVDSRNRLGGQWVDHAWRPRRLVRGGAGRRRQPGRSMRISSATSASLISSLERRWCGSRSNRDRSAGGASRRGVSRAARAGPSVGRRGRTRARASIAHRSPDGFSAAGPGDLDRFAACARRSISKRRSTMIRWFLRRWIDKFERTWNYDASYLRDVLDADPRALMAFSKVHGISNYRKDVPLRRLLRSRHRRHHGGGLRSLHAARDRYGAARRRRSGDSARGRGARSHCHAFEVALAVRFAEASLNHAPEADDLREEVVRRCGKRGLISLSFALVAVAPLSDVEICVGPRPGLHARHSRRRVAAGAPRTDQGGMSAIGRPRRCRVLRGASARADGPCLSHARLARRGRGRGAGCLSALARGGSCRDRASRAAISAPW